MNLASDDSRIYFAYFYHSRICPMVNIGKNILESSETNFMNLSPYVFDVNHVAKIRSKLSITVLEKKKQSYQNLKV